MKKVIRCIDKVTDITLLIFFLLLLLIGVYTMYDTILIYNQSDYEDLRIYKPNITDSEDGTWDMKELSKDVVAWVTINDTTIDYPILQGKDNSEYLNKSPFGEYSLSGSIFLDYRNSPDLSDHYSLLYGHHMEYGKMFGALDSFRNESYFMSHQNGTLTVENTVYNIKLFAVVICEGNDMIVFNPATSTNLVDYIKECATFYTGYEKGKIIGLSTCQGAGTLERLVVFGVLENE